MTDTLHPTPPNPDQQPSVVVVDSVNSVPASALTENPFALIYAALAVLAILLVLQWWSSTDQTNQLRSELARRLQSEDVINVETKGIAKSVQETSKELQVKVGVLESKQAESESHALALQQMYQDLSKNRDDWTLSEIEQVLSTASQQLQLAGNVQGALIALQNVDTRLAKSDKPQFISVRRAITRDIDRLKSLPAVDLPGIALRLDSAISQVETMPLLVDETPVTIVTPVKEHEQSKRNVSKSKSAQDTLQADLGVIKGVMYWLVDRWQSIWSEMWEQVRQLIRIRNVDHPDALLLSPSQGYFVKENVKLRLLNARLALLSRNESAFRSDMIASQDEITRYFDTRGKQTQTVLALLHQIQSTKVSIEMPSLSDSLNAVRNFTVKQ